ncbi:MAG: hypothetical protein ICV73_22210 [Acetobacteraceae bacterium]|nr:hypothetical protein [Acetobacteraceae bacterium]
MVAEKVAEELEAARAEHRRLIDALDNSNGDLSKHRPKLRRAARCTFQKAVRLQDALRRLRVQGGEPRGGLDRSRPPATCAAASQEVRLGRI